MGLILAATAVQFVVDGAAAVMPTITAALSKTGS
jgi:small neutral amino acid transporter SnatA (MarC family)